MNAKGPERSGPFSFREALRHNRIYIPEIAHRVCHRPNHKTHSEPNLDIELEEALARRRANSAARWPSRTSANRLEPECWPEFHPGFKLDRKQSVFTIGSCFARSVDHQLDQLGFNVPTIDFMRQNPELFRKDGEEVLNRYTPPAIYQDLAWTKRIRDRDGKVTFADIEPFLLDRGDGRMIDTQNTMLGNAGVGRDEALAHRQRFYDLFANAFETEVVIVTLGHIECWFDRKTSQYVEFTPLLRDHNEQGRFVFRRLSFADARDFMRKSVEILSEGRTPNILLTTSPIPLAATFTTDDAIIANTHSKSVLRAVAGEIAEQFPNIDYFPSFENVIFSKLPNVWSNDLRHLESDFVGRIMRRMTSKYLDSTAQQEAAPADPRQRFIHLVSLRQFDEARLVAAPVQPLQIAGDPALLVSMAELHAHFGEWEQALDFAGLARQRAPTWRNASPLLLLRCAAVLEAGGDIAGAGSLHDLALNNLSRPRDVRSLLTRAFQSGDASVTRTLLSHIESQFPNDLELLKLAADIYKSLNELEASVRVCKNALTLAPNAAEVHSRLGSALFVLGHVEEAKEACERALVLDPQDLKALDRLATMDMASNDLVSAEDRLRTYLSLAPNTARAHSLLARILRRTNRQEESLAHARRAAELEPQNEKYVRLARDMARSADSNDDADPGSRQERTGG